MTKLKKKKLIFFFFLNKPWLNLSKIELFELSFVFDEFVWKTLFWFEFWKIFSFYIFVKKSTTKQINKITDWNNEANGVLSLLLLLFDVFWLFLCTLLGFLKGFEDWLLLLLLLSVDWNAWAKRFEFELKLLLLFRFWIPKIWNVWIWLEKEKKKKTVRFLKKTKTTNLFYLKHS